MAVFAKWRPYLLLSIFALAIIGLGYLALQQIRDRTLAGRAADGPGVVLLEGRSCDDAFREVCIPSSLQDPTGVVDNVPIGEAAIERIRTRIAAENPEDPAEARRRLIEEVYSPARLQRAEAAFRWVKGAILDEIESWAKSRRINARERRLIARRIKQVSLEFPDPKYPIYGADDVDIALLDELDFQGTKVRVGGAYLIRVNSWFNLVFTLAHELAHAIDPCELLADGLRLPVLDRISACFDRSGWIALRKTRKSCDQDDQLPEVFADWIATRVTAQALEIFAQEFHGNQVAAAVANSVRDLCDDDTPGPNAREVHHHPTAEMRINRIFATHPTVRGLLGCVPSSLQPYCD
ncbi:MAG: hypothetical protein AAB425_10355 [Bdellovibrionota bacterium]